MHIYKLDETNRVVCTETGSRLVSATWFASRCP